ncbi:MAG: prolyl oligopeptidase family serine peptidase [Rhizobiaceae bacterium]|nr:prolyl oligopeptidase family serine peptidase [Rhizobiaceae bacterium]
MKVLNGFVLACLVLVFGITPASAQDKAGPISASSGVRYEFIARWEVDRLDQILSKDFPEFAGIDVVYPRARNAVNLYRVTYGSVVPEQSNRPIVASGLVAVPDTDEKAFPMLSYQHGTVYGKQQVPSYPDQSPETQLMIALFAGQGYVVTGSDYFGMGISTEPEGYLVKGSHQQATFDMLMAARAVLDHMGIEDTKLFLSGWSQGGFVTMAMLERLEQAGVPVAATATASAPLDLFPLMEGFLAFPRKIDASWINSVMILSAFSYEHYYGIPGLARSLFVEEHYETAKKAYERVPTDVTTIPVDLRKLIRPEYFDTKFFGQSAFGRLIATAQAYRWVIGSPVRNYYGETDEAIPVGIGQIAMFYQHAMGSGNTKVEAISTGATSHRGTYAKAAVDWKIWFDGF